METIRIDNSIKWSSTKLTPFDLRRLGSFVDVAQRYATEIQTEMGAMGVVVHSLE